MSDTPKLTIPELAENQSQKYLTHNEALRLLDVLVQPRVLDKDLDNPPASPVEGDSYIIGPSPVAEWVGEADSIAFWKGSSWTFIQPAEGMQFYVKDEGLNYRYNGSSWQLLDFAPFVKNNLTATSDPTATDDENQGYSVLSRWLNTNTTEVFVCMDASAGAAVWETTTLTIDDLGSMAVETATDYLKRDGTLAMTGDLTLFQDPSAALHAATKQYVDNSVVSQSEPLTNGVDILFNGEDLLTKEVP